MIGDIILKVSITLAISFFSVFFKKVKRIKKMKKSLLINQLMNSNALSNYHRLLENTLTYLTKRFGSPFSGDSNNFTTNLAVFYSFAVFFSIWAFNGSGSLSNIEILSTTIGPNLRYFLLFVSFCFVFLSYNLHNPASSSLFFKTKTRKYISTAIVYFPYLLVAIFLPLHWMSAININSTYRTILIILFSSSLGGLILNRAFLNKSGSLTFAITFLSLVYGGGMVSSILNYNDSPSRMYVMILLAVLLPLMVYFVNKKYGTNKVYFVNLLMVSLSIYIIRFYPRILNMDVISVILLYFFVLLPSLNGLMDWLSLSISRILAKGILSADEVFRIIFIVLLDLFIAFILLCLLVTVLVLGTKLFNYLIVPDPALRIPINELLIKTKESPFSSNGLWLIIMLTSTLVPTTFHLFFAINSLTNKYLKEVRFFFIRRLESRGINDITYYLLSVYLILQPFAGFVFTLAISLGLILLVLPYFNSLLGLLTTLSTNFIN